VIAGGQAISATAIGQKFGLSVSLALTSNMIETLDDALKQLAMHNDVVARKLGHAVMDGDDCV